MKRKKTVVVFGLSFLIRGPGGCSLNFLKQFPTGFQLFIRSNTVDSVSNAGGGVSQRPSAARWWLGARNSSSLESVLVPAAIG